MLRRASRLVCLLAVADDAAVGKVIYEVTAQLVSGRDSLPADNTAIAAPTRVSP